MIRTYKTAIFKAGCIGGSGIHTHNIDTLPVQAGIGYGKGNAVAFRALGQNPAIDRKREIIRPDDFHARLDSQRRSAIYLRLAVNIIR